MRHQTSTSCGAIAAAVFLSACAPIPVATTYRIDGQHKMQSVAHWRLLADDTVKQLLADDSVMPGKPIRSSALIFVQEASTRSAFSDAFDTYLIDSLRQALGSPTITQGHESPAFCDPPPCAGTFRDDPRAVYIAYGVQRVDHSEAATGRTFPGLFTLLGAGIWLGHQASTHWSVRNSYIAAVPAGVALDLLSGIGTTPTHTEVVITVSARNSAGTISRQVRNYYVNDTDAPEYPNAPLVLANGASAVVPPFQVTFASQ